MAKGLLRKALHGATKSSSEILGARIEDMRQKRLMNYQAELGMAEAKQQNTWATERDTRLAEQRATEAETAHQRAIQANIFNTGMETELSRESEEIAQGNRLELENRRSANDMARLEQENEFKMEQARAAAADKGIELKTIKVLEYDDMGEPVEVELSGYVDPKTLEVWFVDPQTRELTTTRQQAVTSREQAFLANSAQFAQAVRDDDKTDTQVARTAAKWFENSPDQLPLDEHLAAMGEKREIFEREIQRLRGDAPSAVEPTADSEPESAAAPVVGPSNVNVVPSMLTRATQAVGGALEADAQRAREAKQSGDVRQADRQAQYVLGFMNRPDAPPGTITLPEVTILNRYRLERALESSLLTDAQKTALRAHLER